MEDLGAQIRGALNVGYTREEVVKHLKTLPFYEQAMKAGYTDEEIFTHPNILTAFKQHAAETDWSTGDAFADAVTLGQWKHFKAAQAAHSTDKTTGLGKQDPEIYDKELARLNLGKMAWESLHPGLAIATDIGASAVPMGGAIKGTTSAVRALPRVGRFLTGEGGGNLLTQGVSKATHGALSGAEGGVAGSPMHPEASVEDQAITGAAAGGVMAAAPSLVNPILSRGITPRAARQAETARDLKIDLTPKQIRMDKPKAVSPHKAEDQLKQFQKALFKSMGHENTDTFTQENFQAARRGIGQRRDDLLPKIAINPDPISNPNLYAKLAQLDTEARSSAGAHPDGDLAYRQFASVLQQLRDTLRGAYARGRPGMPGMMSGEEYAYMTHKNGMIDRLRSSQDGTLRSWGNQLRTIMDDAVSSNDPAVKAAWDENSRQFRTWYTLKKPVANAQATGGNLNPAQVDSAVKSKFPDYALTGTPGSDLGDINEAGNFLKQKPTVGGGTVQPVTSNALMKAVKKIAPYSGVGVAAGELIPGLTEMLGPGITGAAMLGGLGLSAGYVGSRIAKMVSEAPRYRDAVINRINNPGGYGAVSPFLVAPAVAGGEMNQQVGASPTPDLVQGGPSISDLTMARQLQLIPEADGDLPSSTEPHITLTRPGG